MATTEHGVTGETASQPPKRVPSDGRDFAVIGIAAAAAGVCAVAANFGPLPRLQPLTGLIVILAIAYCFSTNRRAIDRRTVVWGLSLQILFALIVLKTEIGQRVFKALAKVINHLLDFAFVGSSFVFGPLGSKVVWPKIMTTVLGPDGAQYGVIFAFQVLPTIIFIAALFAILYYFGIMQLVVRAFAVVMHRVMRASGAESLNVAASIFMGQTEAPLTIRPYLPRMTESELMTVMTSGMAHISGGIMAAYILFGIEAQHLLTAVSMGVPGRDAATIGNLLGTRMALNEFVAYSQLGPMKPILDPRSFTIATFALCGFANFSSIGIQIGGIGALAPTRRHDLARLGFRAMIAGTLANFITATIAGFLL